MRILTLLFCLYTFTSLCQSDDPCGAPNLSVNTSCSFATYTNATATATAGVPAPGCASYSGGDVWFTVTVPASGNIQIDANTGVVTDGGMAAYSGACGSLTLIECDDDDSPNGLMPYLNLSGQTPGATLWIRFWEYGNNNNGTFDICAFDPVPPANDDCSGAFPVTVNPDLNCGNTTAGTVQNATQSSQSTTACGGTEDDDVWFSFVATETTHLINIMNIAGSTTDMYHSVWEGTCPSLTLVTGSCSDPNSSTLTGLTIGQTYYIRVYTWTSTTGQTSTFDVCVGTLPPPPANDDCSGALPVAVTTSGCSPTTGSIASATASSQANGCSGTSNDDVWYEFTAPASGSVAISLSNVINSPTDLYHSVYINNCGSPGTALVCSDPNNSSLTGLTPGTSYLVRIFSYSSSAGATTSFDLCIEEVGPCGTPNNQDYCVAPATLALGGGSFSSNTSGTYTSDTPGNLNSVFCGSVENNSWYEFVASATTESFPISYVGGTGCTSGIQAEVYSVTEDVNGCCTNFTSVSNCYNPGSLTLGTVTATGLTIGNTYVLMIDGFGGDVCDFTVDGWNATGILPVELTDFTGIGLNEKNSLSWQTKSERNNDYFLVQKSIDGINFETIGQVDGAGNSIETLNYQFDDFDTRLGTTYYRLKQLDFDGSSEESKIIAIYRKGTENEITSIKPNPTNDFVNVQFHSVNQGDITLINLEGKILKTKQIEGNGVGNVQFNLNHLESGVYFLTLQTQNGSSSTHKIIKK